MSNNWDDNTTFVCGTCMFFKFKDSKEEKTTTANTAKKKAETIVTKEIGRCRRNAPTMGGFPVVFSDDDGCGEHRIDIRKM